MLQIIGGAIRVKLHCILNGQNSDSYGHSEYNRVKRVANVLKCIFIRDSYAYVNVTQAQSSTQDKQRICVNTQL